MQPQILPHDVRNALREILATPALRDEALIGAIAGAGAGADPGPFRVVLQMLGAGPRSEPEARTLVETIESHRLALEGRLLRDPGFAVAAADYLHVAGGKVPAEGAGRPGNASAQGPRCQGFDDILEGEVRRHRRTGRPVALVLLSGPGGQDERLAGKVMAALAEAVRDVDHVARVFPGGFALLLPCTTGHEAVRAAARFRRMAERVAPAAWCCGVAALPGTAADAAALAAAASAALDEARQEGAVVRCARSDRRRHARRPPADVLVARITSGRRSAEATLEDLSLGGALLRTSRPLVPGLRVTLEIADPAPRARRVTLESRVIRSEAPPPGTSGSWRAAIGFEARGPDRPVLAALLAEVRQPEGRG